MLKDLLKVASKLDALGLTKEADVVDALIQKIAGDFDQLPQPNKYEMDRDYYARSLGKRNLTPEEEADFNVQRDEHFFAEHQDPGGITSVEVNWDETGTSGVFLEWYCRVSPSSKGFSWKVFDMRNLDKMSLVDSGSSPTMQAAQSHCASAISSVF